MAGVCITLYGINNIGKSTHAKLLTERLNAAGHRAIHIKYPVYDISPTGPLLNDFLRDPLAPKITEDELQLWFVLNRYQFQPELLRMREEGMIIVAEDYTATGIAWGVAKGLDIGWLEAINAHLVKEDCAILLKGTRDVRAQEASHLHETDHILSERARQIHEMLAGRYGWREVQIQPEIPETADLLWNVVDEFLRSR